MPLSRRAFLAAVPASALAQIEPGFESIFDGSTLKGWTVRDGPRTAFHVLDGAIAVHPSSNFPSWLRYQRQLENFDLRGEFYLKGWMDSGIYLHAPEHGRNTWTGLEVKLFHQQETKPTPYSCGAIFPLIAPRLVKVNNKGEWNSFRIWMDWPTLRVWMNGEQVQDQNLDATPELRYRLRRGYLGLQSLSYPIRFRNLRIQELAEKEKWEPLFDRNTGLTKWKISEGKPRAEAIEDTLRLEGLGHLSSDKQYADFEFHTYVRTSRGHNGGVIFRSSGGGTRAARNYEIQLHNVEGAHFPTGSLYHHKRAQYPRIEDEKWWFLQLIAKRETLIVRINGENVLEFHELDNREAGFIELQAHHEGTWCEFKHMRIKPL
ncbi:MAG: DUF1080 domain-containing protein [Bryobacteraceae bacterium]|nr:DUF1080 domain-containing protein [Bryobacteraceae bacterium]